MLRKVLATFTVLALCLAFAACSEDNGSGGSAADQPSNTGNAELTGTEEQSID